MSSVCLSVPGVAAVCLSQRWSEGAPLSWTAGWCREIRFCQWTVMTRDMPPRKPWLPSWRCWTVLWAFTAVTLICRSTDTTFNQKHMLRRSFLFHALTDHFHWSVTRSERFLCFTDRPKKISLLDSDCSTNTKEAVHERVSSRRKSKISRTQRVHEEFREHVPALSLPTLLLCLYHATWI